MPVEGRPGGTWPLLAAGLTFALGVPLVAALLFLPVLFLAGPHSDLLPGFLQKVVIVAGWASALGLPAWAARGVYRRLRR